MNSYLLTSLPPTPPPTAELFTREWLNPILLDTFEFPERNSVHNFDSVKLFLKYKERAIDTKRKLGILYDRLDKFGNSVSGVQYIVSWVRDKVGLFHIVSEGNKGRWLLKNVLDRNSSSLNVHWVGCVWGEEEKENGLVFVMLDKTAVTWLNAVSKWCNEVAKDNEKEMI